MCTDRHRKDSSFAVPILQMLDQNKRPGNRAIRALVLAPTRELASQISQSFTDYGCNMQLKHVTIFGGVSQVHQVNKIRAVWTCCRTPAGCWI